MRTSFDRPVHFAWKQEAQLLHINYKNGMERASSTRVQFLFPYWPQQHLSDSAKSNRKRFSYVNTIRFNILNCNSLSFVSNVVQKDSK